MPAPLGHVPLDGGPGLIREAQALSGVVFVLYIHGGEVRACLVLFFLFCFVCFLMWRCV